MDDLTDLIELTKVPALLPHRPSYPTVFRWATKGIGPNHIRLSATRFGRRWYCSTTALKEFAEHLAAATLDRMDAQRDLGNASAKPEKGKRTEAQLARDLARAQADFDRPAQ